MTNDDLETSLRPELDEALLGLDELALESPQEALAMFKTLPEPVQVLPEFQLALARSHQALGQLDHARDLTREVLQADPNNADAHHLLGDLLEDLEEPESANAHFLKTLELDQVAFQDDCDVPEAELREHLTEILKDTVGSLPEEIRPKLASLSHRVSLFPSKDEVLSGLDPRALVKWAKDSSDNTFILYGANLDAEFGDLKEFDEFLPQVKNAIVAEIVEGLELSAPESRRLGLLPTDEELG